MIKKMFLLSLSLVLVLPVCSCSGVEKAEVAAYTVNEIETVNVVADSVSPDGLTYTITNNSDETVAYSHYYHLDVEQNGVWYHVKEKKEMVVLMIRPATAAGKADTYECNWRERYGSLSEGHYRLVKQFGFDGTFEKYYIAAEFTVD